MTRTDRILVLDDTAELRNVLQRFLCSQGFEVWAVSRDNLIARGRDHDTLDRSIDVQIPRLRQLVADGPSKPRFVRAAWGVGYMLVADMES
jgi:DNA-binding response OmpR family regulator